MSLFGNNYPSFDNQRNVANEVLINLSTPVKQQIGDWMSESIFELYKKTNYLTNEAEHISEEDIAIDTSTLNKIVKYELSIIKGGTNIDYEIKDECYEAIGGMVYCTRLILKFKP